MNARPSPPKNLQARLRLRAALWQHNARLRKLSDQVAAHSQPRPGAKPVVMMNVSSRLGGLSQNAAFTLLTGWGLRLAGAPVIHFVCQAGMSHCVLGTNRQDYTAPPPCAECFTQSERLTRGAQSSTFRRGAYSELSRELSSLDVPALSQYEVSGAHLEALQVGKGVSLRLGELVLPSLRWALRRHHLPNDEATRYLLREYMHSAYHVAVEFSRLLERSQAETAVIFNGIMYPEAAARWVALQRGLRVITHEVGFRPFSAFFTAGEATTYPIHIPEEFELTPAQDQRLDAYLEARFKGQFTMAGIRFWPEMAGLDAAFLQQAAQFRQIVPVFTNVIYDTSQIHANTLFEHMFDWLGEVLEIIRSHPETFFVIRAHPDEMRPGTAKQSRESVREWVQANQVTALPNVLFIDSQEYLSSYELIQRSKFLMVYNSSIGLEASLMGAPVLCGGKARYTQYPTVFLPASRAEFRQQAEALLNAERIDLPAAFQRNARRFLYYQLYRASLPFTRYLQVSPRPGYVLLKPFTWQELLPDRSPTLRTLVAGILDDQPFLLDEDDEHALARKN